jgi:Bacterial cellulose synthase subunit
MIAMLTPSAMLGFARPVVVSVLLALGLTQAATSVHAQGRPPAAPPPSAAPPRVAAPLTTQTITPSQGAAPSAHVVPLQSIAPAPSIAPRPRASTLISTLTFADLGFGTGIRFANLGGRREIFAQLPQGAAIVPSELVLMLDDMSAHDARRSLEILVNDRSAAAIALDGKSSARVVRIPLATAKARDGYLKITLQYSGAATQDRCIDVRSVGDSLTIRPESAIELDVDAAGISDVATTVALMPREVAVVLPRQALAPRELAAALTVARSLTASGRRVSFHLGYESMQQLAVPADARRWSRGIVAIGSLDKVAAYVDLPTAKLAGPLPVSSTLAAGRVSGLPTLIVSDLTTQQASRLIGSQWVAATRGMTTASIGEFARPKPRSDRVSFTELGLAPALAEVFGRADVTVAIDTRALPPGSRAERLALDVMVAPDSAGERAVVSVFVNERMLGSAVAQTDEPTRFDLPLPDGLVGTIANVRAMIQRRSAQGDCRFEPQGFPAQILGSSSIILSPADAPPRDFSDLVARWANGLEILIPAAAADQPEKVLGVLAPTLSALSSETAAITVKLVAAGAAPAPEAPFLSIGDLPPADSKPQARFDRGRVMVVDRSDRPILDLGGNTTGAIAQIVTAGAHPGLWIKPLAGDGTVPAPADLRLERGDVAFIDKTGVALAMSTTRDTLVKVAYPDQVSWLSVAERFRFWIIGGFWLLVTLAFMLALQTMLRRRPRTADE